MKKRIIFFKIWCAMNSINRIAADLVRHRNTVIRIKLIILVVLCCMTVSSIKSATAQSNCAGGGLCATLYETSVTSPRVIEFADLGTSGTGVLDIGVPGAPLTIGDYQVALFVAFAAGSTGMIVTIDGTVARVAWSPGTGTAGLVLQVEGVSPFALAEATGSYRLQGFVTGTSQIQHGGAYGLPQNFDVAWTSLNGAIIDETFYGPTSFDETMSEPTFSMATPDGVIAIKTVTGFHITAKDDLIDLPSTLSIGTPPPLPPHCRQPCSQFVSGLEDWAVTGDTAFTWQAEGGNPGGNLDVNDLFTGARNYAVSPPSFLSDWSSATIFDSISYDVYLENTSGGSLSPGTYDFRIAGPGGSAWANDPIVNIPAYGTWTTYQVLLDPTDWTIETGTWEDILANVNSLRLNAEFVSGREEVRIDNVVLSVYPQTVANPCPYADFAEAGTEDWFFQGTTGVAVFNPGEEGNSGGYARITGLAEGDARAYPPARFLGDWSSLNLNGFVTIDLRIVERSGAPFGPQEFIRISGPLGSAYVSIDPAALPTSGLVWTTHEFPIDPEVWTVDFGTWEALLGNVTQIVISSDFFEGTETIGLDNFGRREYGCGPIDDTVVIIDPEIRSAGYQSFIRINSIALNPADNSLYGLVRDDIALLEGLYRATGFQRGIRLQAYDRPASLIFDAMGNAFVSEDYSGNLYRRTPGGTNQVWVSGFHSGDDDPFGMTFAPPGFNGSNVNAGDILISDRGSGGPDQIWAFSPGASQGERLVMADPGDIDIFDMTADPDGIVYVADYFDSANIYSLSPDGILTAIALQTPVAGMGSIVFDPVENQLYATSHEDKAIFRIDPLTGDVTSVVTGFNKFRLTVLEIDPARRRLWAADYGYNRIYEIILPGSCPMDKNEDSDVDGEDLSIYASGGAFSDLKEFALTFGGICP